MIRIRLFWLVVWWLPSATLPAQRENLKYALIDNTDPTRWIYVSPEEKPGIRGSQYLFDDWINATLELSNGDEKENLYVNYNLENQNLEISTQDGIKVVPEGLIRHFTYAAGEHIRTFINAADMAATGCTFSGHGYLEILYYSEDQLLLHSFTFERKKPSYNERLGLGDDNEKLIHKMHLWLVQAKQCTELTGSAKRRRKQLSKALRTSRVEVTTKEHKLNLKKAEDVVTLLQLLPD